MKKNSLQGAPLIVMSCLTMLMLGVFQAWSLFGLLLSGRFPEWSATALSLNYTILNTCFSIGNLVAGWLNLKLGGRRLMWLGTLICLCGGWLFSFTFNFPSGAAIWAVYLSYGIFCGIGSGICYNTIMSGVSAASRGRGAFVSGTTLMAFGFGGMIIGAVVNRLAIGVSFGFAFRLLATVTAVLAVITSLLFKKAPALQSKSADISDEYGVPSGKMLKTAEFWLYFIWSMLVMAVGFTVINSAAPIAVSVGIAGSIGMIVSIFNGLSRTAIGAFCDRFGSVSARIITNALALLSSVLLLLSSFIGSMPVTLVGIVFAGVSFGCVVALNSIVIRESFGKKYYAANYSIITISGVPATYIGASVSGVLIDRFGGFRSSFIEITVYALASVALLIMLLHTQKKKPARK